MSVSTVEAPQGARKYWYRFYWGECPVCGRNQSYKERVYDQPKPKYSHDRHVWLSEVQTYDWCMR